MFEIYTDGSCFLNKKNSPGGWACIILKKDNTGSCISKTIISGNENNTTNNRMELLAIIEALEYIDKCIQNSEKIITVYSDSNYCVKGINIWCKNWIKNNFMNIKNPDLWKRLIQLKENIEKKCLLEFIWIKGHRDNYYNNEVDKLSREEANLL